MRRNKNCSDAIPCKLVSSVIPSEHSQCESRDLLAIAFSLLLLCIPNFLYAKDTKEVQLKDLIHIKGIRSNTLIGFGLVIGLSGTGDSAASVATKKAAAMMLTQLGMKTKPEEVAMGNLASVIVTGELTPFARNGDKLDVKVSANGSAKSLAGGTLLQTPLRAGDGKIYAIAQGSVVVGQATGSGARVLTVARVPQSATVEREFTPEIVRDGVVSLSLKNPDITTNTRIVTAINTHFRGFWAKSLDPSSIEATLPPPFLDKAMDFLSELEKLTVAVDQKATVVINERTGTVVMGSEVDVGPVTIAHGDLSIKVGEKKKGGGKEGAEKTLVPLDGSTVGKLVESLNALGVKPSDLIGILQAIYAAGAIHGDLEFI